MRLKEIKPGMVIHCKTVGEANQLLATLDKAGYKWVTGFSLVQDTNYRYHKSLTCYRISADKKFVSFSDISYYENNGDEITEFSSLITEEKTYEDGLNEAWAAANKLAYMTGNTLNAAFGFNDAELIRKRITPFEKAMSLTPQEVIAKLEAYEAEKKIKVGDVVAGRNNMGVVTRIDGEVFYITWSDGSSGGNSEIGFKKTGKHIDISSILAEIGNE